MPGQSRSNDPTVRACLRDDVLAVVENDEELLSPRDTLSERCEKRAMRRFLHPQRRGKSVHDQ